MLERLFSSSTRVRLLTHFLSNPGGRFYLRQLERDLALPVSTLRDELRNLEDIGLLDSSWEGNIKYYTVNQDFIIYPELKSIIFKTQSVGKVIGDNLRLLGEVKAAFVYGSFAKGEERLGSDIDLMIVGRVELLKLNALISSLEDQLRRSINYLVFTPEELDARKREGDEFIADILAEPKIMLIGDENEL